MISRDDVRRIALSFPEATEGELSFAVRDKGIAWYYTEKVPGKKGRTLHTDVLAVRVANLDAKEILLGIPGETFFTDAHYNGYPAVLVRLAHIDEEELTELLEQAWRIKAPKRIVAAFDAAP